MIAAKHREIFVRYETFFSPCSAVKFRADFYCSPAFSKKSGGTWFLAFRHSVRPSVHPSVCPSVLRSPYRSMYLVCATPPTVLFRFFSKLYRCHDYALKICMWFGYNPQINFSHFFRNLNLTGLRADISSL